MSTDLAVTVNASAEFFYKDFSLVDIILSLEKMQTRFFALLDELIELQATNNCLPSFPTSIICNAAKALLSLRDGFCEHVSQLPIFLFYVALFLHSYH